MTTKEDKRSLIKTIKEKAKTQEEKLKDHKLMAMRKSSNGNKLKGNSIGYGMYVERRDQGQKILHIEIQHEEKKEEEKKVSPGIVFSCTYPKAQ